MSAKPDDTRPDPEALLAKAARANRGRLKIFLGAAPGVGKTYAMLEAARARAKAGVDVVAAVIETHGRPETGALMADLAVLPRRPVAYRGRNLSEMDTDALIARNPRLALIDELAHTNAPESRHEKRWQDVVEVLDAGIDVYTTLNVQHIETLNDTVARITGVRVRETVPDAVLEDADEIELVDLPPDELLDRLKAGKVYVEDQAARAMQNFFAKGNLTALRELALRAAADRVDAQLREHMAANAISGPWPTQERILVCLNESPVARDAIRVAKRSADRARAEWIALTVTSTKAEGLPEADKDRIAASLRLAERLGAELVSIEAEQDVASEILDYARRRNVRRIVLGRPRRPGLIGRLTRENVARDLIRRGADFEITLTASDDGVATAPQPRWSVARPSDWRPYGVAALAIAVATALAAAVETLFPIASLSLIFMTAVVAVAARLGLGPSVAASALGFTAYNFFFTEPRFTLHVSRQGEVLTLGLFLAASLLTGNLAARLRTQVLAQRSIVDRTNKLFDFSRRVSAAASREDVVWAAVSHVATTLQCESILLAPDETGTLGILGGFPPEDRLDVRDMTAAQWSWDKDEPAGRGSATLPTSRWFFEPVQSGSARHGVIGIAYADDRPLAPTDRRLLDALIDQIALGMERVRLGGDVERARLLSETDRLRTALLSSVSHDLRTPLVTIIGAAGHLAEPGGALSAAEASSLAATIREEGERLDRYIQNLLDMTRLGNGALRPRLVPTDLTDLIGVARHRLRRVLQDHEVRVILAPDFPLIRSDPVLTEQVLVNILDNAAKYAPPGSTITLSARVDGPRALISCADIGPGIPEAALTKVFEMFYRIEENDRQRAGTGLGLAICKGLIEAQGGTIRAQSAPGKGTEIIIALPLDNPEWPG